MPNGPKADLSLFEFLRLPLDSGLDQLCVRTLFDYVFALPHVIDVIRSRLQTSKEEEKAIIVRGINI